MNPQKLKLKVKKIEWLNKRVVDILFDMVEPEEIEFVAGQHIGLRVSDETSRPYCMYTSPREHKTIGIAVSAGHDGVGANYLRKLKVGDEVEGFGPVGRKQIAPEHKENIFFATVGTGISPALSILTEMKDQGVKSNIKLFFGLRTQEDLFYKDKLDELKSQLANFDYEIVYSQPEEGWSGLTGYVTEHIQIDDPENTQVYAIGWSAMVSDLKEKLLNSGFPQENIVH